MNTASMNAVIEHSSQLHDARRDMKYPTKRDTNINIKEKSKCIDPRQINNAPYPTANIN